jgi:hypothetical protein
VQSTRWSRGLRVTVDGTGVVSHVGAVLLRMLADRAGLTQAISGALVRRGWWPGHDRGRVLVDLAVMIADGGEAICDIDVLRHQGEVFGPVASAATCWRALDAIGDRQLRRIAKARAQVRVRIKLRPGNAGANTAADHLEVLAQAVAQIPPAHRRHLLVRGDSAAATHAVLDWLVNLGKRRGRSVQYSIGWAIGETEWTAIAAIPTCGWSPAINADGGIRDSAQVAELTGLLALTGWPDGMRVIVRRERPHPGAQLSLFEERDGWRYTAFVTNTRVGALQWLEARHRAHARVEDRIRCAKDTGLRRLPSREFAINQAWCTATAIAVDLIRWIQLLGLDGDLALAEPKRLRYRVLHNRSPPGPRATPPLPSHPGHLALGHPHHRRVRPDRGDPRTRLTGVSR